MHTTSPLSSRSPLAPLRPIREALRAIRSEPPDEGSDPNADKSRSLPLGEFLVAQGLVIPADVSRALAEQRRQPGRRVGEILVDLGAISEMDLTRALALKFHLPFVDLAGCTIDPESARGIPSAVAARGRVVALDADESTITIAVADPLDASDVDAIRMQTKRAVRVVLAPPSQLARHAAGVTHQSPRTARSGRDLEGVDELVASLLDAVAHQSVEERAREEPAVDESEGGVIKLVNRILVDAYKAGASDIHIEPNRPRGTTRVRFRVDGECVLYREIPRVLSTPLVARVKILAELDISERRRPQDGKISFRVSDEVRIELRVATMPTVGGNEDIVLRLLPPSKPRPLESMGMNARDLAELTRIIASPYGLILCVGPTGSGKTTTLHSVLGALNAPDVKIWTAEDPVEVTQPGVRQVQINHKIGLDFAAAMRSFLRSDPDVIMVGEMRDAETASTAVTASLTGHLVLSSLHTNNAPETVLRLLDMGLDPFSFSDALQGVLAQRLTRSLCTACRIQEPATTAETAIIVQAYGGAERLEADLGVKADALAVWRGPGCDACRKSGYKGRAAVHELLVVDEDIRHAIATRATAETIRQLAIKGGMRTLLQNGVARALDGTTDMRQVLAVCSR
ncbi:MAG TPA: GspE/PulE family protein [Polyangiaceae bacterium]|jgi:type II secretory ATPase GspE/PulE/Tfp pilus assembly ATPase PilB-like protein